MIVRSRVLLFCSAALLAPGAWAASLSDAAEATALNNRGITAASAGRWEEGVQRLREARERNPADEQIRQNLAGVLSDWAAWLERQGRFAPAEAALREAAAHAPEDGWLLVRLGDLRYFQHSDFEEAIAWWKRAIGVLPSASRRMIADRISQADRDRRIEHAFTPTATPHFDIRASEAPPESFGRLLEEEHARLAQQLGGGPGRITVIVYPPQDLHRLYYQRDWALGFYDGRLRLQAQEYAEADLRMIIGHELAHAFLQRLYGPGLPVWVHEGFAQLAEAGRPRSDEERRIEQAVMDRTAWTPLEWLDRRFLQPADSADIVRAYTQARLIVDALARREHGAALRRFLEALAQAQPLEQAFNVSFAPLTWAQANSGHLD